MQTYLLIKILKEADEALINNPYRLDISVHIMKFNYSAGKALSAPSDASSYMDIDFDELLNSWN